MEGKTVINNNKTTLLNNLKKFLKKIAKSNGSATLGFIGLFIIMSLTADKFLTVDNLLNVARQASINSIVAIGMTFIIITGGIDLSVGAVIAVAGTLVASFIVNSGMSFFMASIITLVIGTFIGVAKGAIISTQKLPAFVVTLALTTILRGFGFLFTAGRPVAVNQASFRILGRGYMGVFPIPVIIMVVLGIIGHIVLRKTRFGRHVYAVGGNPESAHLCGVNVNKTLIKVYAFAGLLTALSGIILASRLSTGSPIAGDGADLDSIAAVVLGGTSLMGGVGTIGGTFIGVAIIAILNNGLNLLNVSSYNQMIAKGVVILLAVWSNNLKMKKKAIK